MPEITPISKPESRPQPDQLQFVVRELELFEKFTRSGYRLKFGVPAPKWDPSRPIKRWFDSTVDRSQAEREFEYKVLGKVDGSPALVSLRIKAIEAATPNLPGPYEYVSYEDWLKPSRTVSVFHELSGAVVRQQLGADWVLAPEVAEQLAAAVSKDTGKQFRVQEADPPGNAVYEYGDERKVLNIISVSESGATTKYNAGRLWKTRCRNGIEAPGHWAIEDNLLTWVAVVEPTGDLDPRPEVQIPLRDLLPNEKLMVGLANAVLVRRTDKESATSGFSVADRKLLAELHTKVSELHARIVGSTS